MENPQEPSDSTVAPHKADGTDAPPLETAPADQAPELPVVEPEPELIAPGVERLGVPEGAAKHIADPSGAGRPSPVFLAVVSIVSLVSDVGSKIWAEHRLEGYPGSITIIENHLAFVLAKNRGGAWGLLQGTNENVRRPFFLLVSAAAIAFIVTLYKRLQPRQRALKWGLPLVLGGALGNVFDRIRYGHVIDFIDYRADWLKVANEFVAKKVPGHVVTDHWPTFNIADVAICVGVGLMAVDMFTARRGKNIGADGRTMPPPPPEPESLAAPIDEIAAPAALPAEHAEHAEHAHATEIVETKPVE